MASGSGSRPRGSTGTSEGERLPKRTRRIEVDMETFDCPICLEPFAAPVYQCNNGHPICGGCHKKLTKKLCPTCLRPIGRNRCIAIEKVIETLQVPCKYAEYGCEKMLQYCTREIEEHEDQCEFLPYRCPVGDCNYEGTNSSVLNHMADAHYFNHEGRLRDGGIESAGSVTTPIEASGLRTWVRTWVWQ